MREWILKCAGLILWSLFLFLPFIARADQGFETQLPLEAPAAANQEASHLFSFGGYDVQLDKKGALNVPVENKWSLKLQAGEDTVLNNDLSPETKHDRLPLDDGERESFRFGIGLNYKF